MPENVIALVYILFAAAVVYALVIIPMRGTLVPEADFVLFRWSWLAVTLFVFLTWNYWLYLAAVSIWLWVARPRTSNGLALFSTVLYASPILVVILPGFGLFETLLTLTYYRLLSLVVLLPIAASLAFGASKGLRKARWSAIDSLVLLLMLWMVIRKAPHLTPTNNLREAVILFADVWLPYYVASRAITNIAAFRTMSASLVAATAVMAAIVTLEVLKNWLLYYSAYPALSVSTGPIPVYNLREEGGLLRATGPPANPIGLGFAIMVSFAFLVYVAREYPSRFRLLMLIGVLTLGILAPQARGPWMGTAAILLCYSLLRPNPIKNALKAAIVGGLALVLILQTPLGRYVPFLGAAETDTIDYRNQLFDVSLEVMSLNPWLGNYLYLEHPLMETMRQGQGIIDIVNTYLQYTLPYGLVGLALFVLPHLLAGWRTLRKWKQDSRSDPESAAVGRVLLSLLGAILLTIGTTSTVSVIGTLCWMTLGLCAGYCQGLERSGPAPQPTSPSSPARGDRSRMRRFKSSRST